jgi:hypothetical protein
MKVTEGDVVLIESLGSVRVLKIYPSGAAIVEDVDDRRWLLSNETMQSVETCLFSYL